MRKNFALLFVACCPAFLAVTSVKRDALAYYPFPGYIEQHLNVASLPADPAGQYCELCHNNPSGGLGTATQPFGALIKAQGILFSSSEAELDAAVDAIRANPATAGYVTDIIAGVNPNTDPKLLAADSETPATLTPAYGCGARISASGLGRGSGLGAAGLYAALLGLTFCVRRRSR